MSEWLRRWTRNPLGSAREGSNPFGVGFFPRSFLHLRLQLSHLPNDLSSLHDRSRSSHSNVCSPKFHAGDKFDKSRRGSLPPKEDKTQNLRVLSLDAPTALPWDAHADTHMTLYCLLADVDVEQWTTLEHAAYKGQSKAVGEAVKAREISDLVKTHHIAKSISLALLDVSKGYAGPIPLYGATDGEVHFYADVTIAWGNVDYKHAELMAQGVDPDHPSEKFSLRTYAQNDPEQRMLFEQIARAAGVVVTRPKKAKAPIEIFRALRHALNATERRTVMRHRDALKLDPEGEKRLKDSMQILGFATGQTDMGTAATVNPGSLGLPTRGQWSTRRNARGNLIEWDEGYPPHSIWESGSERTGSKSSDGGDNIKRSGIMSRTQDDLAG